MDLLEVDPNLFITCRLCLEDIGVYQIVPNVQQLIKYCFDIDVEPFDGLPQLLCKKCHTLLNKHTIVKKTFIAKQITLKEKLTLKKDILSPEEARKIENGEENETAHGDVNISKHGEVNESAHDRVNVKAHRKKFNKSKRRKRVLSTSSTDSVNSTEILKQPRKVTPNYSLSLNKITPIWKNKYTKFFVCKICSLMYKDKQSVIRHYYEHSNIRARHHKVFDVKCMISLTKLDNKPNVTGLNNTVVFSKNRIMQDDNSDSYHILYLEKSKQHLQSDSSDCEPFVTNKKRKVRRLNSQSSNETVFIGNTNKKSETHNTKISTNNAKPKANRNQLESEDTLVCINLDDSSDSNMETNKEKKQNKPSDLKIDMRTIENIVTVCRNKYETRYWKSQLAENASSRAQMESQLKHKILSFGRKNITVKGFNSTGLLRYLEHKNLNVIWEPVSPKKAQTSSRDHSFVRVGAIQMNHDQRVDDDSGWTDVVGPTINTEPNKCVSIDSNAAVLNIIPASSVVITSSEPVGVDQIVLSDIRSIEETNSKKLLNVNPVANPKQLLPKKNYMNDVKPPLLVSKINNNIDQVNSTEQINDQNLVMPVITSTKSLAAEVNNKTKNNSETENAVNNNSIIKAVPRIKVKSVSELMNPQKLVTTDQHDPIWNYNQIQNGTGLQENIINLFVPNTLVSQIQNQSTNMLTGSTTELTKSNTDFVVLDTVDMPNTRTDSPFEYFRNLLLLHGLVLIEANADVSREFTCLLKFKVQFKQENKSNPVTLCLSLHCVRNKFCMCIKDGNQINIHIAKMSANWQWEIIKVYQGDVSTKILLNAQKAGQNVYTNTNNFLCLLKSITHKQEQ